MHFIKVMHCICIAVFILASTSTVAGEPESAELTMTDPSESRLFRILTGRNETLRLRSIAPLKRNPVATKAALDSLTLALETQADQVANGRPLMHSTTELVALLASVDEPRAREALIHFLDCDNLHISMLCADALGRNRCHDALEPLKRQVESEYWQTHYGFRFNLIRALTLMDHPDAYEFLSQVRSRIDGQLLFEIDEIFKKITLDDFLGDETRYAQWRNDTTTPVGNRVSRQSRPDSIFKNASYSESANRIKFQRQQYYGIDIEAKRVLFIIDHSGSMRASTRASGRWGTRLWQAKEALTKAIKDLPEDDEFGIMFYSDSVRTWKQELVYATPENKRDAATFIYRLGLGGSTNTHGALRDSMDFDDDLEAVFLLTDGQPSSGSIIQPAAIVNDIVHRNRLRHLKINTIGIAVNTKTKSFLSTLAQRCSGEFTQPE